MGSAHKRCVLCATDKPRDQFPENRRQCKVCRAARRKPPSDATRSKSYRTQAAKRAADPNARKAESERSRSPLGRRRTILIGAKIRAKRFGLPFNLTLDDIVIPDRCPFLGVALAHGSGKLQANSPSLDRLRPAEGYVCGNVLVISYRANAIKQDATPEELEQIAAALRQALK